MGNENQLEGKWEQTTGTVKEHVGDAIDNEQMEYEGKLDQGKGELREGVGDMQDRLGGDQDRLGDEPDR
jgi:uncharacterized protein YjbJ (UPF0337 family)